MSAPKDAGGPFDVAEWPERLRARVVEPGATPRVRGYDVEDDLARHYSFLEGVLLALGGELPAAEQGRALEVAMQFLSPAPVSEAPTHAAALALVAAATDAGVIGTAAVGLVEQARFEVERHAPLLAWLDAKGRDAAPGDAPEVARATGDDDRGAVARLRAAIAPTGLAVPGLDRDLSRAAAILAVMHACGLRRAHALEVAWVIAKLATASAEALSMKRRAFHLYPTGVPRFVPAGEEAK